MPTTKDKPARVRRTLKEHDAAKGGASNGKAVKAEKTLNACGCGCTGTTYSRFLPGHDSKLKTRLIQMALSGKAQERRAAEKELQKLNWTPFLEKARDVAERRAQAASARATARSEKKAVATPARGKAAPAKGKARSLKSRAQAQQTTIDEVESDDVAQGDQVDANDFSDDDEDDRGFSDDV